MFPSFAPPTSLPLFHDQTGNPNSSSLYYPLTNTDQTNQFDLDDIMDNYLSLIEQPNYQDSTPLNFSAHLSSSNEQDPVLQEMNTVGNKIDQYNIFLDLPAYFSTDEQDPNFQETITAASDLGSSHNSVNISFMPRPNKLQKDGAMSEMMHAGLKLALRMETKLDVVDDGYKWRKYGKKKVKSSPYPRNYFKCSTIGCNVKKRIERDKDDSSYVITTYDGVHNHKCSS